MQADRGDGWDGLWGIQGRTIAPETKEGAWKFDSTIRALADGPLRASGAYVRYQDLDGAAMLERAWAECIRGINRAIDVYALGKAPRYAAIDSVMYDAKSDAYRRVIQHLSAVLREERANFDLAFAPQINDYNGRRTVQLKILDCRPAA